jgi:phosphonate transport system permease protein
MEQIERLPSPPQQNPALATLLSLVVPGLGQLYLGRRERGVLILLTALILLGLVAWLDFWVLLPLGLPFWLWNAWEARLYAQGRDPGTARLVLAAALLIYAIGWQVTEISVARFLGNAPQIVPFASGLFQPRYLDREITYFDTAARLEVPCGGAAGFTPTVDGPTIQLSTTCADPGDAVTIRGTGFPPGTEGELWWQNTIGNRARLRAGGEFVSFVVGDDGTFVVEAVIPRVVNVEPQIQQIQARYVTNVGPLELSETTRLVVARMGETIAQALMATTLGAFFAVFLSFFAARNLMMVNPLTAGLYYLVRTALNILRAVEPLIMAIVFVVWVGLGPFAGVLALMVHTVAALGKLYSESIESIEPGPIEAVTATGANRAQVVLYGVLPQVWPPFIAFTVYRWDINVRMSTIIGFVGGGGIGFLLQQWIRLTDFRAAGAAIWAIAVVVTVLDFFSSEVRKRVV